MNTDFKNKQVAVIGMARTGLPSAEVLNGLGARVVLHDRKPVSGLADAIRWAKAHSIECRTGTDEVRLGEFDLVVPSPGVPVSHPALVEAKARGIEIISEIELAYRISKAPIIAITGTNGKTTTTVLTGLIMRADGRDTYIAGNVAGAGLPNDGKTMIPLVMAASKALEDSVIVAEISTFQLEWINEFRPKVAALLTVASDHMDRHQSVEEYAGLKARIFENQTSDDYAVINADNSFTAALSGHLKGREMLFSGHREVAQGAFVRDGWVVMKLGGVETSYCRVSEIKLPGEHNLENVMAASCIAAAMNVRPSSVSEVACGFGGVRHRMETIAAVNGVTFINNSMCTNVDAAVRSIEAVDVPQVVICGGKDKGSDYAPLAQVIRDRVKFAVLIGQDAGLIENALVAAGFKSFVNAGSMLEAVDVAASHARPGDVVMLVPACASFGMFSSFEERGDMFRNLVLEMFKSRCAT